MWILLVGNICEWDGNKGDMKFVDSIWYKYTCI